MIATFSCVVPLVLPALPQSTSRKPDPPIVNLGQSTFFYDASEHLIAFLANEGGHVDLNGDGDQNDRVVFVHDPVRRRTKNLGLAGALLEVSGSRVAFTVPESGQGATDLNGDGDTGEAILFAYDARNGLLQNLGYPTSGFDLEGSLLSFTVGETSQGVTDLNGDGDTHDSVFHLHDLDTGVTLNSERAGFPSVPTGHANDGRRAAFIVTELSQGADLNGDGDMSDPVLHVADSVTGTVTNLGLAMGGLLFGPYLWSSGHLGFGVREESQSADLNGDGDMLDTVFHVLEPGETSANNLGLAVLDIQAAPGHFAFRVFESGQGQTDLNGDGDTFDGILYVHRLRPWRTISSGVDGVINRTVRGYVGIQAVERSQGGQDLNEDGDTSDFVTHVFDVRSGRLRNTGLASTGIAMGPRHVLIRVEEEGQGGTDLDGDGTTEDSLPVLQDLRTGARRLLRLPMAPYLSVPVADVGRRNAVVYVEEITAGTDLNGDGDLEDDVPHVIRLGDLSIRNLGISAGLSPSIDEGGSGFALREGFLAFLVFEQQEGRDLNGDGDLFDPVLHVAYLRGRR